MTAVDETSEEAKKIARRARSARRSRRPRRRRKGRQIAILVAGWVFMVLGVLGLFLPILQGILFLLIGLFLLSKESAWARWLRQWLRRRYPKLGRALDEARVRSNKLLKRFFSGGSKPGEKKP